MIDSNPLTAFLPEIRARLAASSRAVEWPEFERQIQSHLVQTKLPIHLILPIACAATVGGEPGRALSSATSCAYLLVAMRWFDDLQDRDRNESLWREIGTGRAINMASAALNMSWQTLVNDDALPRAALQAFGKHTTALARGQDLDLQGNSIHTMNDYWRLMRGKTGASLALACEVGALAACPDKPEMADICARFGSHMGVLMQILDDLDGSFRPVGMGDLRAGKVTLPVLYGLAIDHEYRAELADIVQGDGLAKNAERVLAILDSIDTREFLVYCAFEEHRQAITCLLDLPPAKSIHEKNGRDALLVYANLLMTAWEDLLDKSDQHPFQPEHDAKNDVTHDMNIHGQVKADNTDIFPELR